MMNRLVAVIIFVPVAIVLIALAVANRSPASLTIDPFNPGNPALTMELPMFVWLFAVLALGMIIGSVATWFKQGRYRRAARDSRKKVEAMRDETRNKPGAVALPAPGN